MCCAVAVVVAVEPDRLVHRGGVTGVPLCATRFQGIQLVPFTKVSNSLMSPQLCRPRVQRSSLAKPKTTSSRATLPAALLTSLAQRYNPSQLEAITAVGTTAQGLLRMSRRKSSIGSARDGGGDSSGHVLCVQVRVLLLVVMWHPQEPYRTVMFARRAHVPVAVAVVGAVVSVSPQGPPGTGKTIAVVGMLSALLAVLPSHISIPSTIARPRTVSRARPMASAPRVRAVPSTKASSRLSRILVASPSNAAVDELVSRLVQSGVMGRDGKRMTPTVVRVGPGASTPQVRCCHSLWRRRRWRLCSILVVCALECIAVLLWWYLCGLPHAWQRLPFVLLAAASPVSLCFHPVPLCVVRCVLPPLVGASVSRPRRALLNA